jgi:cytochrome c-type biogenesis protein CcmH
MRSSRSIRVALTLAVFVVLAACAGAPPRRGDVSDERWLEARLMAPCCWTQTLDVHESPLSTELREEVHARLAAHESPEAIEDDFATRYGERIRALPKGKDPRPGMAFIVLAVVALTGVGLVRLVRRWTRHAPPADPAPAPRTPAAPPPRDALDEQLDRELADLDG